MKRDYWTTLYVRLFNSDNFSVVRFIQLRPVDDDV